MKNTLDRKIEAIVLDIDACIARLLIALSIEKSGDVRRTLPTAVEALPAEGPQLLQAALDGEVDLYLSWIGKALIHMRGTLRGINTTLVLTRRRAGQSTSTVFENLLSQAQADVTRQSSGILACVQEVFDSNARYGHHSAEVLDLMFEIGEKSKIILRHIQLLERPALSALLSWRLAAVILTIGVLSVPIFYMYRVYSDRGQVTGSAISNHLASDRTAIREIVEQPSTPPLDKSLSVAKKLSELVSTVPSLLIGLAALVGLVQRLATREHWRRDGLSGIRKELLAAAKDISTRLDK